MLNYKTTRIDTEIQKLEKKRLIEAVRGMSKLTQSECETVADMAIHAVDQSQDAFFRVIDSSAPHLRPMTLIVGMKLLSDLNRDVLEHTIKLLNDRMQETSS